MDQQEPGGERSRHEGIQPRYDLDTVRFRLPHLDLPRTQFRALASGVLALVALAAAIVSLPRAGFPSPDPWVPWLLFATAAVCGTLALRNARRLGFLEPIELSVDRHVVRIGTRAWPVADIAELQLPHLLFRTHDGQLVGLPRGYSRPDAARLEEALTTVFRQEARAHPCPDARARLAELTRQV